MKLTVSVPIQDIFVRRSPPKLSLNGFESTETVSQTVSSPLPPTKYAFLRTLFCIGGRGGIRTLDQVSPMPVFETGALNHYATLPNLTVLLSAFIN